MAKPGDKKGKTARPATAGKIRTFVNGQDAVGIAVLPDRGPNLDQDTEVDVAVTGNVTVFGGAADSTSTGSGAGQVTINTTVPFTDFEANQFHSATGGDALGLRFMRISDIDTFTMNGSVTVGGGSATARHTGDNEGLPVRAQGGGANAFFVAVGNESVSTTAALDIDVNLVGPDVTTVVSGANVLGRLSSRRTTGPVVTFQGTGSQLTYSGDVSFTPGTASVTATDGAFADQAALGFVVGVSTTTFGNNANGTLIYDGTIDFTGGDITVSGPLSPSPNIVTNATNLAANTQFLFGQGVAGLVGEVFDLDGDPSTSSRQTIDHRGVIDITAGSGVSGIGVAQGISISGDFSPELDGSAVVRGTIDVNGADRGSTLGGLSSAGVLLEVSGDGTLDVNGGAVTANGAEAAGVQANSLRSDIAVRNGGTVTANGAGAPGIALGSFEDFFRVVNPDDTTNFDSSTNRVTIGAGSSVVSAQFIGIQDESQGIFNFGDDDRAPDPTAEATENATTLDVAGTVTGGNGTAIDLGSGPDTLILRASSVINGATLLGAGADTFVFQDFTETKPVDGGADRDAIQVTVAAGNASMFDPSVETPNLINFETIAKEGDGTLTVPGGAFANGPLDFNVKDGTGIVSGDRPQMNVFVAGGAAFQTDSQVGSAVVAAGGLISENGVYQDFTVNGTVAPGNSIGTINVAGNAVFNAGSTYNVEIEAPTRSDLIAVSGTATINGGSVVVTKLGTETSYSDGQTYRILTAAGGVVRNAYFTYNNPFLFLSSQLIYGASFIDIALQGGVAGRDFQSVARTFNQTQAATALNDLEQTGDALAVYNSILALTDDDEARRAFDLASGEIHASGQHVVDRTFSLFSHTLRQQGAAGLGGVGTGGRVMTAPLGYSPTPRPASLPAGIMAAGTPDLPVDAFVTERFANAWLAPLGGRGTVDADGNAGQLDWWTGGIAGGYEGSLDVASGKAWAGVGMGYLRSHGAVDARLSSMDADNFNIGVYGGWSDGPWSLTGALGYMASRIETERRIRFGAIDRTATSDYWAHTLGFSGEVAYAVNVGASTTISPVAALDASWSGHGGYSETGAGALNLTGASESWTRFDTGLGVALAHTMQTETGAVTFEARALWEHAFADVTPSQPLAFAGSPTGFTVNGPDAGRDRLRLGAGVSFEATENLTIRASYSGLFSEREQSHGAAFGLNVKF